MNYLTLNDASKIDDALSIGSTRIWYGRPEYSRDLCFGYTFATKMGMVFDTKNMSKTHVLLGEIESKDLDHIYLILQAEHYSPMGEARDLIKSKGLYHTSMTIGDVIEKGGKFYMVDSSGFKELV